MIARASAVVVVVFLSSDCERDAYLFHLPQVSSSVCSRLSVSLLFDMVLPRQTKAWTSYFSLVLVVILSVFALSFALIGIKPLLVTPKSSSTSLCFGSLHQLHLHLRQPTDQPTQLVILNIYRIPNFCSCIDVAAEKYPPNQRFSLLVESSQMKSSQVV